MKKHLEKLTKGGSLNTTNFNCQCEKIITMNYIYKISETAHSLKSYQNEVATEA